MVAPIRTAYGGRMNNPWDSAGSAEHGARPAVRVATSKKASARTTSSQQDDAGRYAADRSAERQAVASASARDAQGTRKPFAKTGAAAIQAHVAARGQRQQARRDSR